MKLKVKPSLRIKRRYILFEGAKEDVRIAVLEYLGVLGWAKASPFFVNGKIIAVSREEADKVRAAFELAGKNIKIRKISGTLKGLGKNE